MLLVTGNLHRCCNEWSLFAVQHQQDPSKGLSPADTLVGCEHATWALIKRKDLEGFASYLAEEFYDIFPDGEERTKRSCWNF
jgi:hypothetical protein